MFDLKSLSRSLDLLWIVLFLLLLAGAAWYMDGTDEIGELAYQDIRRKVEQTPALVEPYRQAMADERITRAEYRSLYRAYETYQTETAISRAEGVPPIPARG